MYIFYRLNALNFLNWQHNYLIISDPYKYDVLFIFIFSQVIDISEVQLIYNTSFFKSLATGGNVSRALVSKMLEEQIRRVFDDN